MSVTTPEGEQTYINGEPIGEDQVQDAPPITDNAEPAPEKAGDTQLDDIELQVAHREWHVVGEIDITLRDGRVERRSFDKTYTQKPLSYTAMLQFTGLIGERVSEAMAGPEGLTLDGVLNDVGDLATARQALLARDDFAGVDAFVKGLAKLAIYAPSVVEDCQCIWLRVPLAERPIVKEIWSRSPEDGGLSIAEGEEMLEIFLAQNYREVEDFFVVRLRRLGEKVRRLREKMGRNAANSQPLKP